MKKLLLNTVFFFSCFMGFSQETLTELLDTYNTHTIPYISVEELSKLKTETIILDARERIEFDTSHIENAQFIGYDTFKIKDVDIKDKNAQIVVYCSLGIRSEVIAKKLKKAGFNNVLNLYGGIFEWKNKGLKVVDLNNNTTEKVHVFSKEWSKWLIKGEKVHE
jgi:rhodanese-related sulfurtransferase